MKTEVVKLRDTNSKLIEQINKLEIRAASGFENLTPRPNFKKILQKHNVPLFSKKLKGFIKKKAKTEEIVEMLVM